MSIHNKNDSDFTCELIKILRSDRVDNQNRMDLRVVKWARANAPALEKRRVWERKNVDQPTKLVGLGADDIRFVYENYSEIINLL